MKGKAVGDGAAFPQDATALFGRDKELEVLHAFVQQSSSDGDALLLSGAPGVGKTVLLDAVAAHVAGAGVRVLRAAGAEFEADLSFAGLNQVLHPLFDDIEDLSPPQRAALEVALGLGDGTAPDRLIVCNAALSLLLMAGAKEPLLVIVDDVQWLDRATALVLGFIARRLRGTRVGFLAACRSGEESFFERSGLRGHDLEPLDDAASTALLLDRFPALAPRVRERLLAEAQGNPLALLELPAALTGMKSSSRALAFPTLPLTQRLQATFAARIAALPAPSRYLLLLAALDGTGDRAILQAASGEPDLGSLGAAERARLVRVDLDGRLTFRHPLTRSAVTELSTSSERREAHRALAPYAAPERRAWHLAEATVGPDEEVASLLEATAREVLRRGDAVAAIDGLLHAAEMSPAAVDRGRRMAEATYLGANFLGDLGNAPELLDAVREFDPEHGGSLAGAMAAAYHLLNGVGDVDTAHRLLVGAIETYADPTDANDEVLIEAIYNLFQICYYGGRAELWGALDRALARLRPGPPAFLGLSAQTAADSARRAPRAVGRLDDVIAHLDHNASPTHVVRIGIASAYCERMSQLRPALRRVLQHGRHGGAIHFSIQALALLGLDAYFTGRWDEVQQNADEGVALCAAHDHALLRWPHRTLHALLAAVRGDRESTREITDEILRWALPRKANAFQYYALHARVLDSLGGADFELAYRDACDVSPAGTLALHVPHAMWLVMDLVEAALRTGRKEAAAAHVAIAESTGISAISSRLALITAGAAAMAADDEFTALFERALEVPGASQWPFELARVELVYGERLRRAKETAAARTQLAAALDAFERLGAHPWAQRAASELRATGITIGRPKVIGPEALSPQQLEIARLAAAGLSNKEIGERLFLSHRTVGSHLYQIFPKLGITSRAALRDALEGDAVQ
jgi:DNA-binding CsgD family transcriptional regulator